MSLEEKSLGNTDVDGARKNVSDLVVFGNGDMFRLLCKASSVKQGWMKSTKACEVPGVGCVVQVTTQQKNPDGSYSLAEALTFVPNASICEQFHPDTDELIGRDLVCMTQGIGTELGTNTAQVKRAERLPSNRKRNNLQTQFEILINSYSAEKESNTPDFILAQYLSDCLDAFNKATNARRIYYGHPENKEVETK